MSRRSAFRLKPRPLAVPGRSSARTVATFALLLVDKLLMWGVMVAAIYWCTR